MTWWFVDAWLPSGRSGWVRRYSRGPMRLTTSAARSEYLDTFEAFAEHGPIVRLFRWSGNSWVRA